MTRCTCLRQKEKTHKLTRVLCVFVYFLFLKLMLYFTYISVRAQLEFQPSTTLFNTHMHSWCLECIVDIPPKLLRSWHHLYVSIEMAKSLCNQYHMCVLIGILFTHGVGQHHAFAWPTPPHQVHNWYLVKAWSTMSFQT